MAESNNGRLNQYEAMFLFSSNYASELEAAQKIVRGIIERHQGQILVLKKWDERKLAYEITGQKRGVYILAYFKSPPAAVAQIERDVNLSDEVIRVLVTRAQHLNPEEMAAVEPQPIQVREERPSWDRPSDDRGGRRDDRRDDRGPRDEHGPRDDRPPREERPRAPRAENPEAAAGKE